LFLQLASRLKQFDPEKQQVGEDSEDPMWLQHLQRINQGFEVCIRSNIRHFKLFLARLAASANKFNFYHTVYCVCPAMLKSLKELKNLTEKSRHKHYSNSFQV